ncbi:phosphatase PAP2 family protein [Flaviaesturariibacter amylovorans]|uniref:Phosphatidic acid phosphatase type 2/haloperoxidase domain-containing protein n=1 Tax=Flaviaesturariibacter amylovorans TaxID=1084520 RepID=A0ABP8H827_9BACT
MPPQKFPTLQRPFFLLLGCLSLGVTQAQPPADSSVLRDSLVSSPGIVRLTPRAYGGLLLRNMRDAFTKPFHMSRRDWGNAGKFALAAGALAFADLPVQRAAVRWRNRSGTLRTLSAQVTEFGGDYEGMVIGGIGVYGFLAKKPRMQTAALLATQSYLTGSALFAVLKKLTGRQRPYITDPNTQEVSPRFFGPFYKTPPNPGGGSTNSAFPSGHTTVSFAAATVFAEMYPDRKWVPVLSYSVATLVGLSRITENRHWATDVLAGAALGYLTGRLTVRNYKRYAASQAGAGVRSRTSFRLSYAYGQVLPGLVHTFR